MNSIIVNLFMTGRMCTVIFHYQITTFAISWEAVIIKSPFKWHFRLAVNLTPFSNLLSLNNQNIFSYFLHLAQRNYQTYKKTLSWTGKSPWQLDNELTTANVPFKNQNIPTVLSNNWYISLIFRPYSPFISSN